MQRDNAISIAPENCSFEHYADVRANQTSGKYSDEYIALIGYCGSYGGRYFSGGYGRDRTGKRNIYAERIKNLREQAPNLNGIDIDCCDFKDFDISKYNNCLFLFDPPYRNTTRYASGEFDYDYFYDFCRELSKANIVLVCEYWMPEDFECIWQKERKVLQKSDRVSGDVAVERLYTIN